MIRPGCVDDLEAVMHLDQMCFGHGWNLSTWQSTLATSQFWVLELKKCICGFILGQICLDEYELHKIAVNPEFQGQGYGKLLLQKQMDELAGFGVVRCFLEVRESNLSALALYASMKWQQIALRKSYYADGENALILEKNL